MMMKLLNKLSGKANSQPPKQPQIKDLGQSASLLLMTCSFFWAIATPLFALEVTVKPSNPQLGDTLAVEILVNPGEAAPTGVTMLDKTYPVFPIRENKYRALLPTTPLDRPGRREIRVMAANEVKNIAISIRDRSFPTQSIWLPPGKEDLGTDYEFDLVDAFKALVTPQKFWNGSFLRPNEGYVSTIYGVRRYYNGVFAEDYYHRGVDYAGPLGSPVLAPAAGRVALVGREAEGFEIHGNTVGIDHGQGVVSIMIHLNQIYVREGDMVKAGQAIGTVGSTGASTGPHLHWGLYVHGQSVDPVPWRYGGFE